MHKNACPYCGQGALYRIRILRIDMESYVCDECDTIWLSYESVGSRAGTGVENILNWMAVPNADYRTLFEYHEIVDWPDDSLRAP